MTVESPFARAETMPKRLKLFLWGDTGTGKTTLALQFPKPVVIDMEGGADLYGGKMPFDVLRTTDADATMKAVEWLGKNKHDYRTVVIDPISIYWDAIQKKWSDTFLLRNKSGKGFKFEFYEFQPRDWMTLKAEHKEFLRKLVALDMNVIITAREKILYSDDGQMKKLGATFDGEKNIPYLFDTVVRLWRGSKGEFMASTIKDRSQLLPTVDFEQSYDVFPQLFGADSLTREAIPDPPATEDQKSLIRNRAAILDMNEAQLAAGLSRRGIESMDQLTGKSANEILAALSAKIEKESKGATSQVG